MFLQLLNHTVPEVVLCFQREHLHLSFNTLIICEAQVSITLCEVLCCKSGISVDECMEQISRVVTFGPVV